MAGHSSSKNGVASLAFVPAISFWDAMPVLSEMPGMKPGMTSK